MKIIIVGAGEVGYHIAGRLAKEDKDVVVIDRDPEAVRRVSDSIDVQVVEGSGSSPRVLEEAGIREAEILLAVTDSDEVNLVACLATDFISPTTLKMARLRQSDYDNYQEALREHAPHIDTVINPEVEVVKTINRLMDVPGAVDIGELVEGRINFIAVRLDNARELTGIRLHRLSEKTGKKVPLIAAVIRDEQLIIPDGRTRLETDDIVYFVCQKENLGDSLAIFNKQKRPHKRAIIIGGGRLGYRMAEMLDDTPVSTKIIEKSARRCAWLAEKFNKVVVLHGDGSDQELLAEENVQNMDVVVALTDDEETNILASLLAKRMGAGKAITRISKFSYFPLMSAIGIEQVVSPRLSAINSILQHVRRGKILSAISLKGEQAEVMEAVALETAAIVGKPLKDVSIPEGVLITAIARGEEIIIPSGKSVVEAGDRIIIFARRQTIPKIEKMLTVKLEYV